MNVVAAGPMASLAAIIFPASLGKVLAETPALFTVDSTNNLSSANFDVDYNN